VEEEQNKNVMFDPRLFENGIKGLFVGHYFFQPIAVSFDAIVKGKILQQAVSFPKASIR